MGSDPLETFHSTGKASKHGNSDGEQRADAIDRREHQRQEGHSQQRHNNVLVVPGHCNWQNKASWCPATTLQVSTSPVYVEI
jgi:hypothetical protein